MCKKNNAICAQRIDSLYDAWGMPGDSSDDDDNHRQTCTPIEKIHQDKQDDDNTKVVGKGDAIILALAHTKPHVVGNFKFVCPLGRNLPDSKKQWMESISVRQANFTPCNCGEEVIQNLEGFMNHV